MIPCNTVDISYEMQPTVAAQHARFTSMAPMDPMRTLPTAFPFGTGGLTYVVWVPIGKLARFDTPSALPAST